MAHYKQKAVEINLSDLLNQSAIDPVLCQYFKNLEKRKIILNGEIADDILELVILPLMEMDSDGTGEPIELIVNCTGGMVYNGMALIDVIEKMQTPLTIRIVAVGASMACLLAMAGKNNCNVKTICSKYAVFLLHSGSDCMQGSVNGIKDQFHFSEKYESIIEEYILTHSKISKELYDQKLRHEWWMCADDALNFGIVDEII